MEPAESPDHPSDGVTRRVVLPEGRSRTIGGAIKIFLGMLIQATVRILGLAWPDELQHQVVDLISLGIFIVLELWGLGDVVAARLSRGDITVTGKRVHPVVVEVQKETPS